MDMCHFELMPVALGSVPPVLKGGEASQVSGSVVVVEGVPPVLTVVAVEETLQASGSAVEELTLVLMEVAAGETH